MAVEGSNPAEEGTPNEMSMKCSDLIFADEISVHCYFSYDFVFGLLCTWGAITDCQVAGKFWDNDRNSHKNGPNRGRLMDGKCLERLILKCRLDK
jgi:hypothetical protein